MRTPLRFCMVTTYYPPYHFGGDGTFVYRLSNLLAEHGHAVEVIHCRDAYYAACGTEPTGEWPNHPRVTVHRLKSRAGFLSPLITQQFGVPGFKARRLKQILTTGQFDIIHYHNISLVGGPKVLEYGDAIKLYTTHEYWLACPTHVLFRFNRAACTKPTCFTCQLSYRRPPQLWRWTGMMDRALRHIDAVISPSRFAADIHARMVRGLSVTVLPMFVPKCSAGGGEPPPPAALEIRQPYFLYVGRLEKLKGLQDVIPVFMRDTPADLVVVGTGRYEPELKRRAGGSSRIRFLGPLPFAQLRHLYAKATALIVPSLCYETFGQVVVEAISFRTPVIARDIGALSELVAVSGGGILYRTESELRDAIESLCRCHDRRAQLGERGHAAVSQYWTEDIHLEQYFTLISRIQRKREAQRHDVAGEDNSPVGCDDDLRT